MGDTQSGAFSLNYSINGWYGWNTGGGRSNSANFNASKSNATYQNNAKVRPDSYATTLFIKY